MGDADAAAVTPSQGRMNKDLSLDKPAGHSGVQHNQWHAPTAPKPAPAPGRRNGAFRHRQEPSHRRRGRHCCRQDRHCRGLVRGRSSGNRHRADSPNPAVPGKQDVHLPGLQPGDTTRHRPCRHRPAVGPEHQAPLALALLGTSNAPTPDRTLKTRSSSRPLRTRSPGPRRGRPAPLPPQDARR